jgi:hypothetical protein
MFTKNCAGWAQFPSLYPKTFDVFFHRKFAVADLVRLGPNLFDYTLFLNSSYNPALFKTGLFTDYLV